MTTLQRERSKKFLHSHNYSTVIVTTMLKHERSVDLKSFIVATMNCCGHNYAEGKLLTEFKVMTMVATIDKIF